ncbi:MAG: HAMP domain-containing sensor histidine kinase [Clostridiales bacterium]|nr:HAMP domain-containing sensor histidine kinase [Clostridiales bacterium]MDY2728837.1 HAMP domain-containing sensor histidine kinase [Clostridium sp.]NLK22824.1 HAMP domain-containing histidine kinase [Clostridiales bacterium]
MIKKLEKRMELQEKFLLNVSHDLRSPINTILSILQSLKYIDNDKYADDKINEYRAMIKRNSYKMMKLVDNLIDTTKIEEKYYNLNKQAIDVVSLIENTILSMDKYAKQKSIELIFDTNEEEAIVLLDPEAIDRIIVNLVSNAIKFSPKDSTVMINLYIDENNIKIVVKDNGPGIAEEDQKTIFNRFMQSQKNKESSNEGSGIGLDLVSNLVKLHNGNITLNSTVGVGSEFIISIPRISASVSQKSYKALSYDKVQQLEIEFSDIYL